MKYIVTLFWALLISQVTFYLGSQLTGNTFNPIHAVILAVVATTLVAVIVESLPAIEKAPKEGHEAKD